MLLAMTAVALSAACASLHTHAPAGASVWGFAAPWDPRSDSSVRAHADALDAVVTGFVALDSATLRPVSRYTDPFAGTPSIQRFALVTTYEGSRFHPETVRALASDSVALGRSAGATARLVAARGYRGVVLDLEGLTVSDVGALLRVTRAMRDSAHAHGMAPVALAIPALDTAGYPARALASAADLLVVMLYDQHWLTSAPGAIAAPAWARHALGVRVGEIGAGRLVAAYPTYGYQWRADSATRVISYDDAVRLAAGAGVPLARDPATATLRARTPTWELWVGDAVLLDSLVRDARVAGVTRFAIWRLGLEDPRVWRTVFAPPAP